MLPVLAHIHVYDDGDQRRAQAGNGRYVVDSPCDLPVCTVRAERIVAAYVASKDKEPTVKTTDANLMVTAGRVKARIPLSDPAAYPRTKPDPSTTPAGGIMAVLTSLAPFIATDASKPWATSVCLKGGFAYATNNAVLLRAPSPVTLPFAVNVPQAAVEAIAAKGEPESLGWATNADRPVAITFYYADGTWIRTSLIQGDWPTHVVDNYLSQLGEDWDTPHPDLGLMFGTAAKMSESKVPIVQFTGDALKLTDDAFEADELAPLPSEGRVVAAMAKIVFDRATAVQWHAPKQDVHAITSLAF
jgi:hypothetical protein